MGPSGGLVGDRYELQSVIASGGMGQVWRGRDTVLGRAVAVKIVHSGLAGDPAFLARFRAEARHAALLNHPNIAAVHDYGESTGAGGEHVAYLVMELVAGEPLSALLARVGRVDVRSTLPILRQTAAALAAAHAAGVVHRDVKPANILVTPSGEVKITDFGIAHSATSAALTRTGQVVGTAQYLSPEQAEGLTATSASDVYALGMVGYECLAGRRAFDGESPVQIALRQIREEPDPLPVDVPAPVRALVERAIAKDPARRFPDGAAFREAVDQVAAGGWAQATTVAGASASPAGASASSARRPAATAVLPAGGPRGAGGGVGAAGAPARPMPHRRMVVALGAGALIALLAIVAGLLAGAGAGSVKTPAATTTTSPAPSSGAATSPAGIRVTAADYVGRPYTEVQARLRQLGVTPELATTQSARVPPGQVTAVAPEGLLARGTAVTITYAVAPSAAPSAAPTPTATPTPTPTATPTPTPTPTPAPAPAPAPKGKGHKDD